MKAQDYIAVFDSGVGGLSVLRHLFARMYYAMEKDIVRLADILGHSSINTTRIYTVETGDYHRFCLEKLQQRLTT